MQDTSILTDLAIKEAIALNKNMTQEEKDNLVADLVHPSSVSQCIYGLATGDCFSRRASELIQMSAEKVYVNDDASPHHYTNSLDTDYLFKTTKLNGAPSRGRTMRHPEYWSPIEVIIGWDESMIGKIVDIIKGNINPLEYVHTEH